MKTIADLTANTAVHMRTSPTLPVTVSGPLVETCHYANGHTYHKAQPGEYLVKFSTTIRTFDATTYASFFS